MDDVLETARRWSTYSDQDDHCLSLSDALAVARALIAAHERIKELEAKQSWRPIESAPRDQAILAAISVYRSKDKSFSHWEIDVIRCGDRGDAVFASADEPTGWSFEDYTGWQPLPEPPK